MRPLRPVRAAALLASSLAVIGSAVVTPAISSAAPVRPAVTGAGSSAATPFTGEQGKFTATAPTRIMDTRSGFGGSGTLGAARTASLQVTGAPSGHVAVPASGAAAVVFNLTVTNPTASGYVTVYPTGLSRPNVSNINFQRGWTGANLVTVKLGAGGKVSLFNSGGSTDLIVDVVGWYADATVSSSSTNSAFLPMKPSRLWDSRPTSHLPGIHKPMGGRATLQEPIKFDGVGTGDHVRAVVVTLTALNEQTSGYLTAWSGAGNAPTASVLNYTARTTVANLVIVPTIPCPGACNGSPGLPSFTILNASNGSTDVLIDIWGFYDDDTLANGERFLPLTSPVRIVDTRKQLAGMTTLGSGSVRLKAAPANVAGADTQVLVQNVTSLPRSNTYLTFWPNDPAIAQPGVSNMNPRAGRTVAGLAFTGVGGNNDFKFYNATGANDVLVDVAGSMELPDPKAKAGAAPAAYGVVPAAAVG